MLSGLSALRWRMCPDRVVRSPAAIGSDMFTPIHIPHSLLFACLSLIAGLPMWLWPGQKDWMRSATGVCHKAGLLSCDKCTPSSLVTFHGLGLLASS